MATERLSNAKDPRDSAAQVVAGARIPRGCPQRRCEPGGGVAGGAAGDGGGAGLAPAVKGMDDAVLEAREYAREAMAGRSRPVAEASARGVVGAGPRKGCRIIPIRGAPTDLDV